MDPYLVLGVDSDATPEEIKMAYRRIAMKWHPDRNANSAESRERFHQAASAYRELFERSSRGRSEREEEPAGSASDRANWQQKTDSHDDAESRHEFADTVFWDVMLDYAIKLAQNGMAISQIAASISRNGCPERLARVIAEKAFDINAHFAADSTSTRQRRGEPDQTSFRDERLQGELWRAFVGQRSFVLAARGSVDYYLLVFRRFHQGATRNPLSWISLNKRLLQVLNFSVVLFAAMLLAIHLFPGPSEYKLLADRELLQIPFLVLPLMLLWLLYRRLWLASLGFALLYVGSSAFYLDAMPAIPQQELATTLVVAAICFAPFIALALFANFLYYLKSLRLLRSAAQLFPDHIDQLVWVKNRSGTSAAATLLFLVLFVGVLIQVGPGYWADSRPVPLTSSKAALQNAEKLDRLNQQVERALRLFNIAEAHFNASPPAHDKARLAYANAANNGSVLAAYKLGYLYYNGIGVARDDGLALHYFRQAIRAPLAFQPHSLDITTRFLAESYTNLGILHQAGLGTVRDLQMADRMYRRALEFGSASAGAHLKTLYQATSHNERKIMIAPEYP